MSNPILVKIDCPPDIFDVKGAVVYRRKRIIPAVIDRISFIRQDPNITPEERTSSLCDELAYLYPKWRGVLDVETGDPLCNPEDDPTVFGQLDYAEQLPWFMKMLKTMPGNLNGSMKADPILSG